MQLQYAPTMRLDRLPSALASKSFTFSQGRVTMEITLSKEIFYHGESIYATLLVTNNSRKTVKNLKVIKFFFYHILFYTYLNKIVFYVF